jgi:hypothetical protein
LTAFGSAFALLLLLIFRDPLFTGESFVGRDLLPFFLPIEKAVHEAWRHGQVPLLLREISFGRPLAANPNTGAFYPLRILFSAIPFPLAFKLFPVVHLWIAAVGAFLLARFFRLSAAGAAGAALTFALCGPALSETMYTNIVPGYALLPLLLWAAGRLARRPTRRGAALFGLLWGVSLLVGDVFTSGLAAAGALFVAGVSARRGEGFRAGALLLAASLPGFLLAGIQVVPALLFTAHTVRALGRFPVRVALSWSVSLWRLLELAVPFPFGSAAASSPVWGESLWSGKSAGFFNTLYPGVVAASALLLAPRRMRAARFARRFFTFTLILAAAGYYVPEMLLRGASPVPLRYPEKLMAGAELALALLTGCFLDAVRRESRRRWRIPFAVGVLLLGAGYAARGRPALVSRFVDAHWSRTLHNGSVAARELPGALSSGAAAWLALSLILARRQRKRRNRFPLVLMSFMIADLWLLRTAVVETSPDSAVFLPPPAAKLVRRVNRGEVFSFMPIQDYFSEVLDRESIGTSYAAPFGVSYGFNQDYDASDYYRVDLMRQEIYRDAGLYHRLDFFLAAFGVRSTVVERGKFPNGFSVPAATVGKNWVLLNPAALPGIRFCRRVAEVENVRQAYSLIHDDRVDLTDVTVVESGRRRTAELSGGRIRLDRQDPTEMVLETQTEGPARLLLNVAFSPFRRAYLDGQPAELEAANICLSSVALPGGDHRIRIRENLPGGATGILFTFCGLLTLIGLSIRMPADASR